MATTDSDFVVVSGSKLLSQSSDSSDTSGGKAERPRVGNAKNAAKRVYEKRSGPKSSVASATKQLVEELKDAKAKNDAADDVRAARAAEEEEAKKLAAEKQKRDDAVANHPSTDWSPFFTRQDLGGKTAFLTAASLALSRRGPFLVLFQFMMFCADAIIVDLAYVQREDVWEAAFNAATAIFITVVVGFWKFIVGWTFVFSVASWFSRYVRGHGTPSGRAVRAIAFAFVFYSLTVSGLSLMSYMASFAYACFWVFHFLLAHIWYIPLMFGVVYLSSLPNRIGAGISYRFKWGVPQLMKEGNSTLQSRVQKKEKPGLMATLDIETRLTFTRMTNGVLERVDSTPLLTETMTVERQILDEFSAIASKPLLAASVGASTFVARNFAIDVDASREQQFPGFAKSTKRAGLFLVMLGHFHDVGGVRLLSEDTMSQYFSCPKDDLIFTAPMISTFGQLWDFVKP